MANKNCLLLFLFFLLTLSIYAQNADSERYFTRRISWTGGDPALRFAVEIEKLTGRVYHSFLREYTTNKYFDVSLPAGEYRFRIIPHDLLDHPCEETEWVSLVINYYTPLPEPLHIVRPPQQESEPEITQIPSPEVPHTEVPQTEAPKIEEREKVSFLDKIKNLFSYEGDPIYNSAGASLGTSFADPLLIITIHGTYTPIPNFFAELGMDAGFLSAYSDVENYYSIYPFLNAGYFRPFRENIDLFAGAGIGYMFGKYTFSYGAADIGIFGVNFFAGVNLWNMLNISYTLRTNFGSVNHKLSAGYIYRFTRREKNDEE